MATTRFSFAKASLGRALAALSLLALAACAPRPPAATLTTVAMLAPAAIDESSGLAASRRTPDLLWTHNDSDGEAVLYALGTDGGLRGRVRITGVKNVDWEDLVAFELDGRAWLLVADVGDNDGRRRDCALYVIAEPAAAELSPESVVNVPVEWKIPVRFPDAPHDCEAVAVDVRERLVYLLRKRIHPNALFTLPLAPREPGETPVARPVALVKNIPQPNSEQRAFPVATGRWRGNPTGMDFSADGRRAVVLTYGDVLLYSRRPGESWAQAFARKPEILPPHGLEQSESLCFSADGRSVFVTEEKLHAPLLRYDLTAISPP
jgi:hypothetical protein